MTTTTTDKPTFDRDAFRSKLKENSGGGDFKPIPNGVYRFDISELKSCKRNDAGVLRARLELTISGECALDKKGMPMADEPVYESDQAGRKHWESGACEGEQLRYFLLPLVNALIERYPDNFDALAAVPFVNLDDVPSSATPEGEESQWSEYLQYIIDSGLTFLGRLKYKGLDDKGYENYKLTIIADQSAK